MGKGASHYLVLFGIVLASMAIVNRVSFLSNIVSPSQ